MNMHPFLTAFLGGTLLGLAAVGYLYVHGRYRRYQWFNCEMLNPQTILKTPAIWFLAGLFIVPFIYGK